jgi:hypothetical protein
MVCGAKKQAQTSDRSPALLLVSVSATDSSVTGKGLLLVTVTTSGVVANVDPTGPNAGRVSALQPPARLVPTQVAPLAPTVTFIVPAVTVWALEVF